MTCKICGKSARYNIDGIDCCLHHIHVVVASSDKEEMVIYKNKGRGVLTRLIEVVD